MGRSKGIFLPIVRLQINKLEVVAPEGERFRNPGGQRWRLVGKKWNFICGGQGLSDYEPAASFRRSRILRNYQNKKKRFADPSPSKIPGWRRAAGQI